MHFDIAATFETCLLDHGKGLTPGTMIPFKNICASARLVVPRTDVVVEKEESLHFDMGVRVVNL